MKRQLCFAIVVAFIVGLCVTFAHDEAASMAADVKALMERAVGGDAISQRRLGLCYGNGNGVEQNYTNAFKWFEKAANQGDSMAEFNLGVCYYRGEGVAQNDTESLNWFRKAAAQGNVEAQNFLKKRKTNVVNRALLCFFSALAGAVIVLAICKCKSRKCSSKAD